ncbi:Vacuolar calcium ion transporter [Elsinoe australis]|uniref:Vacuolar calcium ion transporter n=1 Tax=Elsinoe australis TaxID=40998 RepID=A0A2P8A0C1_9PEZI|nr:Vacuolar calcium ion transporter [Elsinoe australis]
MSPHGNSEEGGASGSNDHGEHGGEGVLPTVQQHVQQHVQTVHQHVHSLLDGVHHEGESGRAGFHVSHFLRITWTSSCVVSSWVNLLWPFVPLAIIFRYALPHLDKWVFALSYVAMVPCANLVGFAGQELARKLPKVSGILIETALGSIVEIILFLILIFKHEDEQGNADEGNLIPVIQAAILGSILTNLLLCLGLCFFFGGLRQSVQTFHAVVSETGTGLLLIAGFGLLIPSAFYSALKGETVASVVMGHAPRFTQDRLLSDVLDISRTTSIILMVAFGVYIWYNARSSDSIFNEVLEADEHKDTDHEFDLAKPKYTFTECVVALVIALTLVTMMAVFLVERIEDIVEAGVPDQFLGLILIPLVEKAAEHLTAIDEAWDGQMNFALYHCLGPSIQTALFNGPLVVLVGWALGKQMDLNFEIFMIALLLVSILVVGNFLRDQESNYLEGALLVFIYIIVAVAAWYYPNPDVATTNGIPPGLMSHGWNAVGSSGLKVQG